MNITTDHVIGPIVKKLAEIIEQQINPPPQKVYQLPPDRAPEDNTVTIILNQYKVLDDTNGKLELRLAFSVTHWWTIIPHFSDALEKAYAYLLPYILAFSDWNNQETDLYRIVQVNQGGIKTQGAAGEQRCGLVTNVEVITEVNIPV